MTSLAELWLPILLSGVAVFFISFIARRVPLVCAVSFLISLVPVVGLILVMKNLALVNRQHLKQPLKPNKKDPKEKKKKLEIYEKPN